MTKCSTCGFEAENASYCPECGEKIVREPISAGEDLSSQTVSESQVTDSPFVPQSGAASTTDYTGESPVVTAAPYQASSGIYEKKVDGSGQMIFAVVNIVISALLCCCCIGIFPLIFAIIAAVFASGANKAVTQQEAEDKLKTAKILNIVALVAIVLCIIGVIIGFALNGRQAMDPEYWMEQYSFSYNY
ncbi:MAG: hypothetical protein GXY43_03185 [Clostridiaceae bacterium]|jgi:Trk-type K+ transport system membrane component|nr:hypothetical protein [Clostridiaceae bacterium]